MSSPLRVYHGTDASSAQSIKRSGVSIEKSSKGYFGMGFYTTPNAALAKSNYADFSDDDEEGVVLAFDVKPSAVLLDLRKGDHWDAWKALRYRGLGVDDLLHRDDFHKIMQSLKLDGVYDESFGGWVFYNPKVLTLVGDKVVRTKKNPLMNDDVYQYMTPVEKKKFDALESKYKAIKKRLMNLSFQDINFFEKRTSIRSSLMEVKDQQLAIERKAAKRSPSYAKDRKEGLGLLLSKVKKNPKVDPSWMSHAGISRELIAMYHQHAGAKSSGKVRDELRVMIFNIWGKHQEPFVLAALDRKQVEELSWEVARNRPAANKFFIKLWKDGYRPTKSNPKRKTYARRNNPVKRKTMTKCKVGPYDVLEIKIDGKWEDWASIENLSDFRNSLSRWRNEPAKYRMRINGFENNAPRGICTDPSKAEWHPTPLRNNPPKYKKKYVTVIKTKAQAARMNDRNREINKGQEQYFGPLPVLKAGDKVVVHAYGLVQKTTDLHSSRFNRRKVRSTTTKVAIPKGKRAGETFTKGGRKFTVVSYLRNGKRVRYARKA